MHRLAIWLTLLMGVANGWRTWAAIQQRSVLNAYGTSIPVELLIAISLFWTILFLTLAGVGWRNPRAVWLPIPVAFLTYALYNFWLPTPTLPLLYWHLFLTIFTAVAMWFGGKRRVK